MNSFLKISHFCVKFSSTSKKIDFMMLLIALMEEELENSTNNYFPSSFVLIVQH
jgi:hypothetical protein